MELALQASGCNLVTAVHSRLLRSGFEGWDWRYGGDRCCDEFAQKFSQPPEDEAEVVAGGGENGIGLVALAALEVVAIEMAF